MLERSGATVDPDAPEEALASRTPDGIRIAPLYTAADGSAPLGHPGLPPFTRGRAPDGNRAGWDVRQRHDNPDPGAAHDEVLADLEGGVSSLWLQLGPGRIEVADLPVVLADVLLDLAAVSLDAGPDGRAAAEAYLALAAYRGVAPESLTGCLGLDPLGTAARTGADRWLAADAEFAARAAPGLPGVRAMVVDALPYHDAGGTDAQELGYALATGVAYLRALTEAGLTVRQALDTIEFRFAATADQFATIAKFRAGRRTWARVAQACGEDDAGGQRQHAVTSWPMLSRRDPWNNMLRATIACFGACAGGADAVTVLPYDAALGRSDAFARRIARNTPALLVEEAHIAEVVDPAGGSWYVEALTEALAERAWAAFQEVEAVGGMAAALGDGLVAGQVGAAREARRKAIEAGTEAIVGVTVFPNSSERPLERPPAPPDPRGGLPRIRWSQWHEGDF